MYPYPVGFIAVTFKADQKCLLHIFSVVAGPVSDLIIMSCDQKVPTTYRHNYHIKPGFDHDTR